MKKPSRNGRPGMGRPTRGQPRFPRELAIIYEDDSVVAVNKPPGLLAVPVKGSQHASALSILAAELRHQKQRVLVVHRIDRFTSGVLLFSKTDRDRAALIRQFLSHTPVRRYLTVIRGQLPAKDGSLIHYFRRAGQFQKLSKQSDPRSTRAELQYSVQQPLRNASLVLVTLLTGLQNQIRVQFSAIGHPVVGDRKYNPEEAAERRIERVALHASYLEFIHPRTGETISLECEPPADFQGLVRALSR